MKVKILKREFIDKDHYLLWVERPKDYNYKPGQFTYIESTINNNKVRRFYSFASHPEEENLLFYIKRVPNGLMSNYLAEIPLGSTIEIGNPMGHFTLDRADTDRVIFIGAGTGIAPIRPLTIEAVKQNKKVIVVHQERYKHLLVFRDLFEQLPIIYIPILSKEQSEYHGHVQDYIDRLIYNDATYYICGSRQFVIEIANLLKSKGINKIVIEAF